MKFKLLGIGQKFEYQGELYVKTSPLIASNMETGHNKMIPAYAALTLQEQSVSEEAVAQKDTLNSEQVIEAFNDFYVNCVDLIEDKNALDIARDKFMQKIIR